MGDVDAPLTRWETVEVFGVRGMAEVAGSALRSAGIPFRIMADDGGGAFQLPFSLRTRGAELQVPAEDAEEARALLGGEVELDALDMAEAYSAEVGDSRSTDRPHLVLLGRVLLGLAAVGLIAAVLGDLPFG